MFRSQMLKASDQCDRCGAQAYVLVVLLNGDLLFCGHHFQQYQTNLEKIALSVNDQRALLALR